MSARIAIITYTTYGHIEKLADAIEAGVKSTGATVDRLQFQEIVPESVLKTIYAAPKPGHKVLTNPDDLKAYDGFLMGFPTRFGRSPAAVSSFFDQTGGLWMTGGLVGKFAGIFTSTASQHGGQETTALTTIPWLAHHGISFVPIGFVDKVLSDNTEIVGGSAYGAATIANGDGSRQPSANELLVATNQGKSFSSLLNTFVAGKAKLAAAAPARADPGVPAAQTVTTQTNGDADKNGAAKATEGYDTDALKAAPATNGTNGTTNGTNGAAKGTDGAAKGTNGTNGTTDKKVEKDEKPGLMQKLAMSCGGGKVNYES